LKFSVISAVQTNDLEISEYKPLRSVWLKAAVVGSVWASVEIIVGSFLHNLRIPLTGAILSFAGVYLLVACFQTWKETGLIWRAGVICALMKSISPSAMILGPMIGILTEALILEFVIFIIGKNLVSYLLGGALAVFSTLLQKVVGWLILYGFDFITILDALYRFGVKQVNLNQLSPEYAVMVIVVIYFSVGMIAAILGYRSGRRYLRNRPDSLEEMNLVLQQSSLTFPQNQGQRYSLLFLIFNLLAVISSLVVINSDFIAAAIIFPVGYIGFCIFRYTRAMRRFRNTLLWAQFIVITIATAFLWNGFTGDNFFSTDGLIVGLKMIYRAVVVITGYAAISVELRNPLIKSIMVKKGFSSLYQSLGLAFAALPEMIATMPRSKVIFKKSSLSFSMLFQKAEIILKLFEKEDLNRPTIFIITGEIGEGKTTFAQQVVHDLRKKGLAIAGFLAPGIDDNGKRNGFRLSDLSTGVEVELCTRIQHESWIQTGPFYFNPEGLKRGHELLQAEQAKEKQLIVIDEIGPLELNDRGWADSIETLCRESIVPQMWIVRKGLVSAVARKWNAGNVWIFDIGQDTVETVGNKIGEHLVICNLGN